MKTNIAIVFGISALILLFVLFTRGEQEPIKTERTNREVALTCTTDMATEFHIHPTLEIVVNGQIQEIPVNIGVRTDCMNALHTHDAIGTIHVESPERRDFTLADFFAVWGEPFTSEEILGYKTDETHRIKVLVDGKEVDTYENTVLKDKEKVIISYEAI
ncbi:hypothetical protein K2Y00_01825 [Patescibacteria group bacterium]|nr:hypothetical protein [Patescibacteria group bacterium]